MGRGEGGGRWWGVGGGRGVKGGGCGDWGRCVIGSGGRGGRGEVGRGITVHIPVSGHILLFTTYFREYSRRVK